MKKSKRIIVSATVVLGTFLVLPALSTPKEAQCCLTCVKENISEVIPTLTPTPTTTIREDEVYIDSIIENMAKENLPKDIQVIVDNIVEYMLEENKDKLELRDELKFTRYPNAPKNTRKSYMSYKAITTKTSRQYKMQQIAYTGKHGIRQVNGRYCVALGSAYARTIGTYVDIILENGEVIPCILADQKQDIHTDQTNRVCFDGSLVEFVVDTDYIINKVRLSGDVSVVNEKWHSMVEEVIVYEKIEEF